MQNSEEYIEFSGYNSVVSVFSVPLWEELGIKLALMVTGTPAPSLQIKN